jgi:(p)ppGpp synthase/HD superfamily hydrolase
VSERCTLEQAIMTACGLHSAQVDKQGQPYILHVLRVMFAVSEHGHAAMTAAVLHDTVEDCNADLAEVEKLFGREVADAVDAVSRRQAETYEEFIERCSGDRIGRLVKVADIRDNLSRIAQLSSGDRVRLEVRYRTALEALDCEEAAHD